MDQEWKKLVVLDILTFSRLILTTDSTSAVCFPYAALKVSAIILVECSGMVYWDVRLFVKEATNEHFYVSKYFNPLVFVLKQNCCIRKGQQDSRKYPSSSFSFHQIEKSMQHDFRLSVQQVPFLASSKRKAKMKVIFCCSMVNQW